MTKKVCGYNKLAAAIVLSALRDVQENNGEKQAAIKWLRSPTCKGYLDFLDLNYNIETAIKIATNSQVRLSNKNFIAEKDKTSYEYHAAASPTNG